MNLNDVNFDYFPTAPHITYKDKGWKGGGHLLGTGTISTHNRVYLSFEEAKKFVHKLNLKTQKEWQEYCKSGNKPSNIPSSPKQVYKNKGWDGFGDWLGTGRTSLKNRVYRSFEDSKIFVHKLGLKSRKEWDEYCKSGKKPLDIPNYPRSPYKNKWKGWKDWLGY